MLFVCLDHKAQEEEEEKKLWTNTEEYLKEIVVTSNISYLCAYYEKKILSTLIYMNGELIAELC